MNFTFHPGRGNGTEHVLCQHVQRLLRSRADHNRCRPKSVVLERAKSLHYVLRYNLIQIRNNPLQCAKIFGGQLWNRFLPINPLAPRLVNSMRKSSRAEGKILGSWNREPATLKIEPRFDRGLSQTIRVVIVGKLGIVRIIFYMRTQSPHWCTWFFELCPGRVSEFGERKTWSNAAQPRSHKRQDRRRSVFRHRIRSYRITPSKAEKDQP
jgi:hypothetical protein